MTKVGLINRVKTALMGDVARYGNGAYLNDTPKRSRPEFDPASAHGRSYTAQDIVARNARGARSGIGAGDRPSLWARLRSIGEYDAERTR